MSDVNVIVCPICNKLYPVAEIEKHVNKCIFLNCPDELQKRKRSPSPVLHVNKLKSTLTQKSLRESSLIEKEEHRNEHNTIKNVAHVFQKPEARQASCSSNAAYIENNKLSFVVPLAKLARPNSLDEFFGHDNVLGKNSVLRSLLEKGEIPNMILWGPPGCGKTSLSAVVAGICKQNPTKYKFVSLCAASSGVKEVQNIITFAKNDLKFGRRTILFMDEIHRFNKRQQDSFLLSVEIGEIILLGATTENPSFSLNSALLSRCRVIVMEKLEPNNLYSILEKAAEALDIDVIDNDNPCKIQYETNELVIENTALKWLADISDGDARIALSNLQLVIQHYKSCPKTITADDIKENIKKSHMLYDRAGEEHYNLISAMHKSIRGSDENAALYWTTRMIVSGEDPRFIARRLVRAASEDIGNSDPMALQLAVSTMQGCQLLGMPESDVLLAQCAIYLARAPKSREADSALARAKAAITNRKGSQPSVPMHLRNAPTKLMKDLGYGQHDANEDFTFMPPELNGLDFFK